MFHFDSNHSAFMVTFNEKIIRGMIRPSGNTTDGNIDKRDKQKICQKPEIRNCREDATIHPFTYYSID